MTTTWSTDAQVYTSSALAFPALTALNKSLVAASASATTMDALRVTAQTEVLADLQRAGDGWSVSTSSGTTGASGAPYPIMGSVPGGTSDSDDAEVDPVGFRAVADVAAVFGTVDLQRLEIARVLCSLFRSLAQLTAASKQDTYAQARDYWWEEYQRLLGTLAPAGGLYTVG